MIKIGFVVNPYAGMGGAVGLKGTDGRVQEAIDRGAVRESPAKAIRFLSGITRKDLHFFTAGGEMGEDELVAAKLPHTCLYHPDRSRSHSDQETPITTTAGDTSAACMEFIKNNCDIIIFCGGDGTARDV